MTLWRNRHEQWTPFVLWKTSFSLLIIKIFFHTFQLHSFPVLMANYFLAGSHTEAVLSVAISPSNKAIYHLWTKRTHLYRASHTGAIRYLTSNILFYCLVIQQQAILLHCESPLRHNFATHRCAFPPLKPSTVSPLYNLNSTCGTFETPCLPGILPKLFHNLCDVSLKLHQISQKCI